MKLYIFILLITLAVFTVGGGFLFGVFEIEHQHEYGEWQTRTPATCTEDGVEFRVCECGEGEETRAIVSLGHSYATTVTEPTCTEGGYTTYTCNCGHSYVGDETNATGHSHTPVVTEPTCTEGGYTTYTCKCGDKQVGLETEALGHDFTNEVAEEKYLATNNCGEKATYYKSCHCGEAGEETFEYGDVLAHQYETVVTEPTCTEGGYTTYTCDCGASYVDNYVTSIGHNMTNMSDDSYHWTACTNNCGNASEKIPHSAYTLDVTFNGTAMEGLTVKAEDLTVTATCECDKKFAVTEGIVIENGTLVLGENTVTVKVGDYTSTVTINAEKLNITLNGTIVDDTYVSSSSGADKNGGSDTNKLVNKSEMGTRGNMFRTYFRFSLADILADPNFIANSENAKVQISFVLTVPGGIDANTIYTLKAYAPMAGITDISFSDITWNNVDDKIDEATGNIKGTYYQLHWNHGYQLVSSTLGHNVSNENNVITFTLTYSQIAEFVDSANGTIILAFAVDSNTSSAKIASMENDVAKRPSIKVVLNNDHFHVFGQNVDEQYLASADCGKKAVYYKSCACGVADTATFEHGDAIEHTYGDPVETKAPTCTVEGVNTSTCSNCGDEKNEPIATIPHSYNEVVTKPTCEAGGYTTYTCDCGASYVGNNTNATGHTYGEWLFDESYHWQACACGDIANKATHEGGEATETEHAICDTCKQPYGGLASHVHNHSASVTAPTCTVAGYTTYTCTCGDVYTGNEVAATGHTYGEWETVHPATCEGDEVLVHYCACGESETGKGALAFGHDMQTKYDENNHWTECAHNCGLSTDPVAHFGGEATETEQAVCEGCNQPYGEYKPAEKTEATANGKVVADTYIASGNSSDLSGKDALSSNSGSYRPILKIDLSEILKNPNFDPNDATIEFTFRVSSNVDNLTNTATTFNFYCFTPGAGVTDANFRDLTWENCGEELDDAYHTLYKGNGTHLLEKVAAANAANKISIYTSGSDTFLKFTFNFSEIAEFICMEAGDTYGYLVFGFDTSKTVKFSSSDVGQEAKRPSVKVTYYY